MDKKTIQALEYNKILELLEKHATCPPGRLLCKSLKPSSNFAEIVQSQEETSAALSRIRIKGNLNFGGVRQFGEVLKRLSIGSSLNIAELMHIKLLLENTGRAYNYGKSEDSLKNGGGPEIDEAGDNQAAEAFDALDTYFSSLKPLVTLKNEIAKCIISESEVSDNASPRLSELSRKQKNIELRMHSELQNVLNSHREYLMDSIITMRDGAYCLPIKAEFKNKVHGIVHDHSATGSTIFIEPMAIIRLNNELREIEIARNQEIEAILNSLSAQVSPYIDEAKRNLEEEAMSFEELISKIEQDKLTIEAEKKKIDNYKAEIERLKNSYEKKHKRIEEIRESILEKARREASDILSSAKETADTAISNINKLAAGAGMGSQLEKERGRLRESLKQVEKAPKAKSDKKQSLKVPEKLKLGESVYIHSLKLKGTVSSLPNDKGKFYVQMGILRSQVSINDVEVIEDPPKTQDKKYIGSKGGSLMKASHISPEINVIGMNVDEACLALDKYLDDALLSHLEQVRIIHGRGTGTLQRGIHAYLKKQSQVKSYQLAEYDDGGNAVTIVKF